MSTVPRPPQVVRVDRPYGDSPPEIPAADINYHKWVGGSCWVGWGLAWGMRRDGRAGWIRG
jgi:hypothetical protein